MQHKEYGRKNESIHIYSFDGFITVKIFKIMTRKEKAVLH